MRVDLNRRLTFPFEIVATNLRPDLVLWSNSSRIGIVELTVLGKRPLMRPLKGKTCNIPTCQLRKKSLTGQRKYTRWKYRALLLAPVLRLLKELGIKQQVQQRKNLPVLMKEAATGCGWSGWTQCWLPNDLITMWHTPGSDPPGVGLPGGGCLVIKGRRDCYSNVKTYYV